MTEPRFYVVTVTGWKIDPSRHYIGVSDSCPAGRPPGLSASVLDRLLCHRDVATFRTDKGGLPRKAVLGLAQRLCDRLNREHDATRPQEAA